VSVTRGISRSCAVCGATAPDPLFRQQFAAIEGATIVDGYDVVTCRACGFAYADDIPEQQVFDDYYRAMSKYEYHQRDGEESPYDRVRMADIASDIEPLVADHQARILDIGCATGRLLYLLRERGFPSVTGLDPSQGCVDAARRLYDVRVLQGSMSEFPETDERFDVIILIGVLEHIRDLDAAMRRVRSILAPKGLVYVEVPNAVDFYRWPNAPFQDFSTEHINFFAPKSLNNLFARYGFTQSYVKQHERQQSYGTTMSCLSAAFQQVDGEPVTREFDNESRRALERYVADSEQEEQRVKSYIEALVTSSRSIFVWGVGTNASRLLTTTRLGEANIEAFVDSNVKYHGKRLAERPVISPDALVGRPEPILILSRVFQREIADQIRKSLGPDREILTLYRVE
jgi:2-polyprenyl-3-methyl-5-hydroxy-6-metoxy-1,4-benzoquinol methylase